MNRTTFQQRGENVQPVGDRPAPAHTDERKKGKGKINPKKETLRLNLPNPPPASAIESTNNAEHAVESPKSFQPLVEPPGLRPNSTRLRDGIDKDQLPPGPVARSAGQARTHDFETEDPLPADSVDVNASKRRAGEIQPFGVGST